MPHQLSCACATIWHAHDAAERTNALYIMLPYHAKHAGLRSFSLAPPLPAQYYLMTVQWALCMNVAQMHAGWGGSSDTGHFVHMNMCRCACIPVPAGPRTSSRTTPITITSSTAACSRKSICRATCGHQAGDGWAPFNSWRVRRGTAVHRACHAQLSGRKEGAETAGSRVHTWRGVRP